MKMKVHQTLVWLNLLSLGTKGLTEPTIGIQLGLCHGRGLARTASQQHSLTTLIRHFVSIKPAYTVPPSCLSQRYCLSESLREVRELKSEDLPAGPVRQGEPVPIGRLGRHAGTAAGHTPYTQSHRHVPARPAGLQFSHSHRHTSWAGGGGDG